ncbi:MAG: DUF4333 domain-containing protein [Solirubrobacteraceae bacterium]
MRSRATRSRVVPVIGAVAATLLLAACGTETLNQDEVESTITAQFKQQGVPLTEVSCKDDVKAEVGEPLSCTGKNPAGTVLRIEGKVSERNGDKARFEAKAVGGIANGATMATQVKQLLEKQAGQTAKDLTCPETIDIPTKEPARCTLTAQDDTRYGVSVTVDDQGKVNAQVDSSPQS